MADLIEIFVNNNIYIYNSKYQIENSKLKLENIGLLTNKTFF